MRKFFTQDIRTNTFEPFNYFMNWYCRISGNKNMHMVRHYFKRKNFNIHLISFVFNNLHKSIFNFTNENRASSFRTPYQMIIQKIYMMFAMLIFHVDNITHINSIVNRKFIPSQDSGQGSPCF